MHREHQINDPDAYIRALATLVRSLRKSRNMSQRDLASLLTKNTGEPYNHSYISRIESGAAVPSTRFVFELANLLGMKMSQFYTIQEALGSTTNAALMRCAADLADSVRKDAERKHGLPLPAGAHDASQRPL